MNTTSLYGSLNRNDLTELKYEFIFLDWCNYFFKQLNSLASLFEILYNGAVMFGIPSNSLFPGSNSYNWYGWAAQPFKRLWEWGCSWSSHSEDPSAILRRIKEAADLGIQKANSGGVIVESPAAQLNNELNHVLIQHGVNPNPGVGPALEVGTVAMIQGVAQDQEVTRAVALQDRVDRTNWRQRRTQLQTKLIDKLGVFAILIQMRNRTGIVEQDNLQILSLVKQATEGPSPASVWKLFTSQYELSFFQKIVAAFYYLFCFKTGLVQNTIDAYLGAFITQMTTSLTTECGETRTRVFRSLIENVHSFLVEDLRATEAYANGTEAGLLENVRDRAIERHYDSSLKTLCENFSSRTVLGDPRVRFFKDLQDIPFVGLVFFAFEWMVNKLIIQRLMMNSILPQVLESAVKEGIKATQPDKLPFAISLTQFFTSQLEKLRTLIENDKAPTSPAGTVAGTEELPPTIKLLIQCLELEGKYTPFELQTKIAAIKRGGAGFVDGYISKEIEKAIVKAGNTLFSYLNQSVQSGELFAKLLELSLAPFSGEAKTEEMLRAEFDEEFCKFERISASVFQNLIKKAISGGVSATKAEHQSTTAQNSLTSQKIIAQNLFTKIEEICGQIEIKVGLLDNDVSQSIGIQQDIVQILQILQVLDSRKEFQERFDEMDKINKNEIWNRFVPLFKKMEEIQSKVLQLQNLSDEYPHHISVHTHLTEMETFFAVIENSEQLSAPLFQSMSQTLDKISRILGSDAPVHNILKTNIERALELSTNMAKEQNSIDAIEALAPLTIEGQPPQEGLLSHLLNYQKGRTYPRGFRMSDCRRMITKNFELFSDEEKRTLENLFGDGSEMTSRISPLLAALQNIHTNHFQKKAEYLQEFINLIQTHKNWISSKKLSYEQIKTQDQGQMKSLTTAISSQIKDLQRDRNLVSSSLTLPLSSKIWKSVAYGAPLLGWYFGYPGTGAFFGTNISEMLLPPSHDSNDNSLKRNVTRGGMGALASVLYYFGYPFHSLVQGGLGILGSHLIASSVIRLGKQHTENQSLEKVQDIFKRAYSLSLNPRVYKAATTRAMLAVTKSVE